MKKILFLVMAVAAMTFTSCDGTQKDGAQSGAASQEQTDAQELNQYEGKSFTVGYPKAWKESYAGEDMLNAGSEDNTINLDITFNGSGPSADQLKQAADNFAGMKKNNGATVDEPKIEGNVLKLRSVKDGEVDQFFIVVLDGTKGVSGSVKFKEDKAAEAEAALNAILGSVKLK